jgi:tetratricopeptide (TPR) repeat protein
VQENWRRGLTIGSKTPPSSAGWDPPPVEEPPRDVDQRIWLQANELAIAARTFMHRGDLKKARDCLEQAQALFVEAWDRRQVVIACPGGIGDVAVREGGAEDALDIFERTCSDARNNGDTTIEAFSLMTAGAIYSLRGDEEIAQAYRRRAATIAPAIANMLDLEDQISARGSADAPMRRSNKPRAIPACDTSNADLDFRDPDLRLALADRLLHLNSDPQCQLFTSWTKGEALLAKYQYEAAREMFSEALTHAAAIPATEIETSDGDHVILAMLGRADCCIHMGRLEEALADTEEVFRRLPESVRETKVSPEDVAAAWESLEDDPAAWESLEREAGVWEKRFFYAKCCNLAGQALWGLGRSEEAQTSMEQALDVLLDGKDVAPNDANYDLSNAIGTCAVSLSAILVDSGHSERALEKLRLALRAFERTRQLGPLGGVHFEMANALAEIEERERKNTVGAAQGMPPRSAEVIHHFEVAKDLFTKAGHRPGLAIVAGRSGLFLLHDGKPAQALSKFREAAVLHRELGRIKELVLDRNHEGLAYRRLGLVEQAREAFKDSREIASEHGLSDSEWQAAANLGALELSVGQIEAARTQFEAAIAVIESQRALLVTQSHSINFFIEKKHVYERLVQILLMQGRAQLAFLTVERSRSRALLDLMRDTAFQPGASIPPEWLTEEARLMDESRIAARELEGATGERTDRRVAYLKGKEARKSLDQLLDKIAAVSPEYSALRRGEPASFEDAFLLTRSDRRIVLVEYFVTDQAVHVFGIGPDESRPEVVTLPLNSDELRRFVRLSFGVHGKVRELVADGLEDLWHAYNYLVDPITRWANVGDIVYLIPHGLLHFLPLHALMIDDRYLIERNPIAYAPSASVLKFCRAKRKTRHKTTSTFRAVVFGDSRENLPMARREAEDIADLFGVRPLLGCEVTRPTVQTALPTAEIIHFAGHGFFSSTDPLSSGLMLANDEILTARDVFNLKITLDARLVVLSGCETGINEQLSGDELLGLLRAFLFVGAPSLIVSMWRVNDESTAFLMNHFYDHLRRGVSGVAMVDVLQQAILATKSRYPSMDRWAPFMIVGDWT